MGIFAITDEKIAGTHENAGPGRTGHFLIVAVFVIGTAGHGFDEAEVDVFFPFAEDVDIEVVFVGFPAARFFRSRRIGCDIDEQGIAVDGMAARRQRSKSAAAGQVQTALYRYR